MMRAKRPETEEYQKWTLENKKLWEKAKLLLKEFYEERKVPPNLELKISEDWHSGFRIYNGGEDYKPVPKALSEVEKSALGERLKSYQEEMRSFTEFLKNKYFEEKK